MDAKGEKGYRFALEGILSATIVEDDITPTGLFGSVPHSLLGHGLQPSS